jgi:Asp-tRNA(Asn)/Glu-tRNA(Gln) amidotransferase A subunit family amidase
MSLSSQIDDLETRFKAIEPSIRAYLPEQDRFDRLRRDAYELEARHHNAAARPPLYGALLGVKDIFHVDGFPTRAGTQVPAELFAGDEGYVVSRLKQAGALIVGKTVTTEFAYFEPGPTRNPHNLEHTPGGSSSGSAAAIAAGLAQVAIGTQTVGSVIRPAAYCGVVGFKPSFARVDTTGLVGFSSAADHVGFFSADVADMAAIAAAVIDDWTGEPKHKTRPVLAAPLGAFLAQSTALAAFESQLNALEEAGYHIKRIPMFDDIAQLDACHQDLIAAELAQQHRAWFAQHQRLYRPRTAALIQRGQSVAPGRLQALRENRFALRARILRVMDDEGIDLWICPSAPDVAPRGLGATGSPAMNMPWTHAGLPALSLPAGQGKQCLPLGLQLIGKFNADEALMHFALGIEQVF